MARPMPREEPVTIATRPVRSNKLVKASSRSAAPAWFQADSKFIKVQQSPAKADQRKSKDFS
jgi:hypothetical protein